MSDSPMGFWEQIQISWKALVVITAAVTFGFIAASALMGFVGLPERVDVVEGKVERLEQVVEAQTEEMRMANCLTIAEQEGLNWRSCREPRMREQILKR